MASSGYSRWLQQGAFSLFNRISVVCFGFLNIFFMVRLITPNEVGIWVLFTSITTIMEMVRNGFIRNPFITHFVSSTPDKSLDVVTASLTLHGLLAFLMSILLVVFGKAMAVFWGAPGLELLCYIYAVNSLVLVPYLHFEYLLQSKLQLKGIFVSNFIRLGLLSIYIAVSFIYDAELLLTNLAFVQLSATIVATLVSYLFVRPFIRMSSNVDINLVKTLFHFGKYTFGTTISSMLIRNMDSWMIGRMVSTTGVAMYNPAIRISNIIEVPTLSVTTIVFPRVNQKLVEQGEAGIRDIYIKSVSLILALMLPVIIPLYFLSDWVILIIFGEAYREAIPILQVTIFYTLIIPFNRQFGTIMDGLKMPKINFYLLVTVAFLNMIFNYFFIKWYGIIGAAYGTVGSYGIVFMLNQIILYRKFAINTFAVPGAIIGWYTSGWRFLVGKAGRANVSKVWDNDKNT